jgi:hypothetical protein
LTIASLLTMTASYFFCSDITSGCKYQDAVELQ